MFDKAWDALPGTFLQLVIESMLLQRCLHVIAAAGGHFRFYSSSIDFVDT